MIKNIFLFCSYLLSTLYIGASLSSMVFAQNFPDKPLRLIVPFPPGGPTDIVARPLSQFLGDDLKQQVIIDNKGGAGGTIGADFVARAAPDGYTLFMGTVGTHAINPSLYKKLSYDAVKDFTPIALVASAPIVIAVNSSSPIKTLDDLIKLAKQKPESLQFGTAGNGTPGHLTAALFESTIKVNLKHIPYKGSAPAVTDLLGGQIDLVFDPIQSVLPHIISGKLRALAIVGDKRSSMFPDVPTYAESGYPGIRGDSWIGLFAPAGTPKPILNKINAELQKVLVMPDIRQKLLAQALDPLAVGPDEFDKIVRDELRDFAALAKAVGLKIE